MLQVRRHLLVGESLGQQLKHLHLAWRKAVGFLGLRPFRPERLGDAPRDGRGHRRAAGEHVPNGIHELAGRRWLEQVAAGTGGERVEYDLRVLPHREHDDLRRMIAGGEAADAFDAVHARQVDVHDDDFGTEFRKMLQGFLRACKLADAFEVRFLLQDGAEAPANARVILDDCDGNFPA